MQQPSSNAAAETAPNAPLVLCTTRCSSFLQASSSLLLRGRSVLWRVVVVAVVSGVHEQAAMLWLLVASVWIHAGGAAWCAHVCAACMSCTCKPGVGQ